MLLNIEEILLDDKKIGELNNTYIRLLGITKYDELEEKMWENLKKHEITQKTWKEIQSEIIVEKTLIYAIASEYENGFNKIINICNSLNMEINRKYEKIEKDYNFFINELRHKENLYDGN